MDLVRTNAWVGKLFFLLAVLFCLSPYADPPIALLTGLIFSQLIHPPFEKYKQRMVRTLLQCSVVGLGFGMNLTEALQAGKDGLLFTIGSICMVFCAGLFIGKIMKIDKKITYLISTGTAICGGSAIAAISPMIDAEEEQIPVAMGTIFILNAIALLIFPLIGHYFNLTQHQFGLWSAIAIHDTSSVVGAAQKYGAEALRVATVVKLERALWIIPLSIVTAFIFRSDKKKVHIPYFIFFFVAAMAISTFFPFWKDTGNKIHFAATKGMTLTLFLVGTGLTRSTLKSVGIRPLLLGLFLWILISVVSLIITLFTV